MDDSVSTSVEQIVLPATLDSIPHALSYIEGTLGELDCPPGTRTMLVVAADEIVSNIVKFAYDLTAENPSFAIRPHRLGDGDVYEICFIDQGVGFNPLKDRPKFDAAAAVTQRKIGGQGIKIVQKIMDKVEYERKDNNNILRIQKAIAHPSKA